LDIDAVLFIDTFKIQLSWTDMTDRALTRRAIVFSVQLGPPPPRVEYRHNEWGNLNLKTYITGDKYESGLR
jgi:hypothetical protein